MSYQKEIEAYNRKGTEAKIEQHKVAKRVIIRLYRSGTKTEFFEDITKENLKQDLSCNRCLNCEQGIWLNDPDNVLCYCKAIEMISYMTHRRHYFHPIIYCTEYTPLSTQGSVN